MSVLSARTAGRGRLARGQLFQGQLFRRLGTVPAVAGIAYTVSWVAGLALPVPNLPINASGAEVIARYADHVAAVQAQFALTEGLPAIGLAIVAGALARAAHRSGERRLSLITAVSGAIAAAISLTQYALGAVLAGAAVPGHATGQAGALFEAVNRLDGIKMFALAVLALAGAALAGKAGLLPRWLRYAGGALAATITVSGIGYLLLIGTLAPMAYVAGVLLLVFVTGTGVALGRKASPARGHEDSALPGRSAHVAAGRSVNVAPGRSAHVAPDRGTRVA